MSLRNAVLLVVLGGILLICGSVFALAFHDYTVLSLQIVPTRDIVVSVAIALLGMILLLLGIRGGRAARRTRGQV
jgi:hypothetical protein